MIRNMEVINQNINKKLEKKKKDKRNKRDQGLDKILFFLLILIKLLCSLNNKILSSKLRPQMDGDRNELGETSLYSACILAANCLSNASNILQEVSGETR